jgi:uncharacterized protein
MRRRPPPYSCARTEYRSVVLRRECVVGATLLALSALAPIADAQAQAQAQAAAQRLTAAQQQAVRAKLNDGTLLVATSHPQASYLGMATDLASALTSFEDTRIVPLAGAGGLQNLQDLLFLRGIDLAIVPSNVLAHARVTEAMGSGLPQRVVYITKLYGEEVHLLAGRGVKSIEDLRGKQVGVPASDGTAQFTANDLFSRLNVRVEIVAAQPGEAIAGLISGRLAAALLVAGKPVADLAHVPKDGSVRLLNLPFSSTMEEAYSPAVFAADDYPQLLAPGQIVETLAVSPVLLANDAKAGGEETARRIARAVPALFSSLSELAIGHRHPKWREVNLAATLPGWSRLPAAEEWLVKAREQQAGSLQKLFETFLRTTRKPGSPDLSPAEQKRMFDDFVNWTRRSLGDAGRSVR